MPTRRAPCSTPGCPNITAGGRCDDHRTAAADQRGTSTDRGYDARHRHRFRAAVLDRDPTCTCRNRQHRHHAGRFCWAVATVADHHPLSRRQLIDRGLDPNDPDRGRGLCKPCHDPETAQHQPGGWNAR